MIGSITEYLFATWRSRGRDRDARGRVDADRLADRAGGRYNLDHVTGEFDAADPDVERALEPGAAPRTTFGLITEGPRRRRERGLGAFTVMSCDNLQGSGRLTRKAFTAIARLRDPGLAGWIEREVRFPNSIVDRITPATTDADRAAVRERFGIEDRWPVVCEPCT